MTWRGELEPTEVDVAELLRQNPLAAEQLKVIVLRRMYGEAIARTGEPCPAGRADEERP